MTTQEKRYDPKDTTLKFTNRPNDLDSSPPEEGDQCLRAEMSCGHAVTPESLTGWCRSLLDQGHYIFKCPALEEGTTRCDAVWSYKEVRRLALLTPEETQYFEENMARLAAAQYCEFKNCPECNACVEREDLGDLSVQCTLCTADKGECYLFCWQCLKTWKGKAPRSDRCDNDGCINHDIEILKNCRTITLPRVKGVKKCPSIRACPTCGQRVEHDNTGCKNIICPRCHVEFCFVCLKLTPECLKTSSYFIPCSDGVAPRQTSIPVWRRNSCAHDESLSPSPSPPPRPPRRPPPSIPLVSLEGPPPRPLPSPPPSCCGMWNACGCLCGHLYSCFHQTNET